MITTDWREHLARTPPSRNYKGHAAQSLFVHSNCMQVDQIPDKCNWEQTTIHLSNQFQ